jgi:hypothetical protein
LFNPCILLHPAAEVCNFKNRTLALDGKETVATQMISSMKPQCLQVKSNMISKATDFSATSFVTSTNQSMLSVTALNKQRVPDSSSFNSIAPNHAQTDLLQTIQDRLIKLCNLELRKFASPPDPPGLSLHCHLL